VQQYSRDDSDIWFGNAGWNVYGDGDGDFGELDGDDQLDLDSELIDPAG
jgi:hypothetical protein